MEGRELSIGLGFGNPRTYNWIKVPKPISFLRETSQSLRRLLDGESVCFADYPELLEYFNFNPKGVFPIELWGPNHLCSNTVGATAAGTTVGGKNMEGLIFGGHYMAALRTGRVPSMIQAFDNASMESGRTSWHLR
ncbi:MAG: hypothetical protein Ct9H300mP11_24880 [Chloroflexota bacterium]|nr:MAG: hypothetical protein Ct9H300mP11_24880 [Chloroflexota bacterium]